MWSSLEIGAGIRKATPIHLYCFVFEFEIKKEHLTLIPGFQVCLSWICSRKELDWKPAGKNQVFLCLWGHSALMPMPGVIRGSAILF